MHARPSPLVDPDGTSEPGECPDDAIAVDTMTTELGDYGSIQVEECVTRAGNVDTYTYTVTNIDFLYNGCGLCLFAVPKPAVLGAIGHSEPVPWLYSVYSTAWIWRLPTGHCGLQPGDSTVFTVSMFGPTIDVPVLGVVGTCATMDAAGELRRPEIIPIRTTGPGESGEKGACCFEDGTCAELTEQECADRAGVAFHPDVICAVVQCPPLLDEGACCFDDGTCAELTLQDCTDQGGVDFHSGASCAGVQCPPNLENCPDLIVEITSMVCRNIGAAAPQYEVTIEARVTNIGGAAVTQAIWVRAESDCGDETDIIHTDLDPGDSATAQFVVNCGTQGGCRDVDVTVDFTHLIDECNEGNNVDSGTVCCR
jgi:hypothetical protein